MQNKLWVSNIAPEVTDADIHDLLAKYATGIGCADIERVEGDGSRPGAVLTMKVGSAEDTMHISQRLNGMFWRGRTLVCTTMR